MIKQLPQPLIGVLAFTLIALNTLFWCLSFVPVVLVRLLGFWSPEVQRRCSLILMALAGKWVACNSAILGVTQDMHWDVEGLEDLDLQASYLVVSNHRSWTDIFVLQHVFQGRIPFIKFFLKEALFWVPLLGLAWWALDFPFMKRYSREYLAKHPERKGDDVVATRRSCDRFRSYPVSVLNFLEGTRFTEAKREKQQSPYRYLLRPKAGGVSLVLAAMSDRLSEVLDVTLLYPESPPQKLIWQLLSAQIPRIVVRVRRLPMPENTLGRDYLEDRDFQMRMQAWVNQIWQEKDATLAALMAPVAAQGQPQ
ncbi:MAG: acyltransferase [Candidatus Sericytochromatia bacterium]